MLTMDKAKPKFKWVPRERYIPDTPHPKGNYKWQATRAAQWMRQELARRKKESIE